MLMAIDEDKAKRDEMENYLAGTEATYRAMGISEREAKERAMQDWHTYKT